MRFYALMVKSLCEGVAKRDLERMGFHAVAPILVKRRRKGPDRGRILKRGPLFRGYVFVALSTLAVENRVMPLRAREAASAKGAIRFVAFRDRTPVPIPQGFVESIEAAMARDGYVEESSILRSSNAQAVVDHLRVRIAAGLQTRVILRDPDSAFSGLEGEIDYSDVAKLIATLDVHDRVRILIRIMNAVVPFEVDRNQVEMAQLLDRDVRANGPASRPTRTKVRTA